MPPSYSSSSGEQASHDQLNFFVRGRDLFDLTLKWEEQIEMLKKTRDETNSIESPVVYGSLGVCIDLSQSMVDDLRDLMAAAIPPRALSGN